MDDRRVVAALAVMIALASGCERDSDASSPADTQSDSPTGLAVHGAASDIVRPEGFDRAGVSLESPRGDDDTAELDVWFAGNQDEWHQGLTGVTDLDGAAGMLFAFDRAAEYRFYMWQTPMPLDIYFFDAEHEFVGRESMEPCLTGSAASCERYSPGVPFLLALEVPTGSLDALAIDEMWTLTFVPSTTEASLPPGPTTTDH